MSSDTRAAQYPSTWAKWLAVVLVLIAVVFSSFATVDEMAEEGYENLFQRAFVTFALARTLNGVISAIQGTELALTPAGVGVTLTPGELLDPVNDLVERFSWIMLGATVSLGVQQVLLDIGQWWPVKLALGLLGAALIAWWLSRGATTLTSVILLRAFMVFLLLRFAVPLALLSNEWLFNQFLLQRFEASTEVIESAGAEFERVGGVALEDAGEGTGEEGLFDDLQRAISSTRESLDFKRRVAVIKDRAAEVVEHIIHLSVLFVLQTAILPIVFLWLALKGLKICVRWRAGGQA